MTADRFILVAGFGAAALACAAMTACRAGGGASVEKVNDRLRGQVLDLEARVATLEGLNAELGAKLAESERVRAGALPTDVLESIPRCVGISLGSLSGYEPARRGKPAKLIVDIQPVDAHGRFVQIVGTLTVEARVLPPIGSGEGQGFSARAELRPAEVRDAYRSGLLGPRYTVELVAPEAAPPGTVVMRARFADALAGRVHEAEAIKPLPGTDPGS